MGTTPDSRTQGATPTPGDRVAAEADPVRNRESVLLIEDEPGIVDFVRRGLEAEGFAVEAATDGIQGERMALSGDFDAVVLDLMLPGAAAWTCWSRCVVRCRACR